MEVDMSPSPYRTRSSTKRARSPSGSSSTQYDRPSKRVSSGLDTSVPLPFNPHYPPPTRFRCKSEDWVSQTQGLRLASPLPDGSGFSTPVSEQGAEVRIDEVMIDEPMGEDNTMSVSPPRPPSPLPEAPQAPYLQPPDPACPSSTAQLYQNPSHLKIPAIQIQAATPSPVQVFAQSPLHSPPMSTPAPDVSFAAVPGRGGTSQAVSTPQQSHAQPHGVAPAGRKQRFTMGPRADCEMCRMRVKGHYMHFN